MTEQTPIGAHEIVAKFKEDHRLTHRQVVWILCDWFAEKHDSVIEDHLEGFANRLANAQREGFSIPGYPDDSDERRTAMWLRGRLAQEPWSTRRRRF